MLNCIFICNLHGVSMLVLLRTGVVLFGMSFALYIGCAYMIGCFYKEWRLIWI